MNELEERAKHERNLLANIGAGYQTREVLDVVHAAALALYLRDERIRQLEAQLALEDGRR